MNAYDYYGITPDVLLMAKPLGGGLPISALVTTNAIASALSVGDHGSTFGGNPVAAAAGCVLLEELSQPGFLESIREKGSYLESELKKLAESFPEVITNVRGVGLMWGIEVKEGGPDFVVKALDKGLVINCTAGNVLRCLPALTITEKEMDSAIKILRKLFESV